MANRYREGRWIVDTAGAGFVTQQPLKVGRIRWSGTGLTPETDNVVITDHNDEELWSQRALGTTVEFELVISSWWHQGFKVPTLDGGRLEIWHM